MQHVELTPLASSTRTQARIHAILHAKPHIAFKTALEAFQLLRGMEAKQRASQSAVRPQARMCCFDTEHTAWASHVTCHRCQAIIPLLHRESALASDCCRHDKLRRLTHVLYEAPAGTSPISHATLAGILLITDCASEGKRRGSIPLLPVEVIRSIFDYAGLAAPAALDSSTTRALPDKRVPVLQRECHSEAA